MAGHTAGPWAFDALLEALKKIAELRYSEADEPFDEALELADAAIAKVNATADTSAER